MERNQLKRIDIDGNFITDRNGKFYRNGDVFDIHQTVNGCNLFRIIINRDEVIVYYHANMVMPRAYEYNIRELLELDPDPMGLGKSNEIVNNIYTGEVGLHVN